MRRLIIVAGSNRTGTSLLASILAEKKGFVVPEECEDATEYRTYECETFRSISRRWDTRRAKRFAGDLAQHAGDRILLKYPKASLVIDRWLEVFPDARLIYVYRPRAEAVESQIAHWWGGKPFASLMRWKYRSEWDRGFIAMAHAREPKAFTSFSQLRRGGEFEIPNHFGWDDLQNSEAGSG